MKEKEAAIAAAIKTPEGLKKLAAAMVSPIRGYRHPDTSEFIMPLTEEERFEQMLINKAW